MRKNKTTKALLALVLALICTVAFAACNNDNGTNNQTYTVTFNANGGTGTMQSQTFTENVSQEIRANTFTRDGHYFSGWATSASGGVEYSNGASLTATANLTLYAVWTQNGATTYTITFDPNGGTGTMTPQIFSQGVWQSLTINAFTYSGHAFTGWNTSANGTGFAYTDGQSVTVPMNTTLYAQWQVEEQGTQGLAYTLSTDSLSYEVSVGTAITEYSATEIVIPSTHDGKPVSKISDGAFSNCTDITTVIIPSRANIGTLAFSGCTGLIKVSFTGTSSVMTTIGLSAFLACTNLTSIVFPSNLTVILGYAFSGCSSLPSIILSDSIFQINESAFSGNSSLTIYSDESNKPSWWNSFFNFNNRPIFWNCTLSTNKSYVVSFTKDDGKIVNPEANNLSAPRRDGYTFDGWATTSDGTIPAYNMSNIDSANNGVTLYAIWTAN